MLARLPNPMLPMFNLSLPMPDLYLTRAQISYETAAIQRIHNCYDWHQRAWTCFPNRDGEKRDFLTRLDRKPGHYQLLILSPIEPIRPGWCNDWATKEVPDSFLSHDRYHFSLLANPTRKVKSERNPKNGRREPITHREDRKEGEHVRRGLLTWLRDRGERAGFETLGPIRTVTHQPERFERGTLHAVDFRGILQVSDQAAFRHAAQTGIGSAKAFGFGMLALAPL